jgi:hypothetical protein
MTLRRRFSPVLPFGQPGSLDQVMNDFRPMALRRRFSPVLPLSMRLAALAVQHLEAL